VGKESGLRDYFLATRFTRPYGDGRCWGKWVKQRQNVGKTNTPIIAIILRACAADAAAWDTYVTNVTLTSPQQLNNKRKKK